MVKINFKIWLKEKFQRIIGHWPKAPSEFEESLAKGCERSRAVIGHWKRGFTIIELLMSTTILAILVIAGASIYTNFYNSVRNLKASNQVYEEARFTMERIAREIRNATVDFEEYYNQAANFGGSDESVNSIYGQNYCQYSRQFYGPGPDGEFGTYDDESLGSRKEGSPEPIPEMIQNKLFLINGGGNQRTYIKKITDAGGLGKVGLLKLDGKDYGMDHINSDAVNNPACLPDSGERDGLIDTWLCEKGFKCVKQPSGTPPCDGTYDVISDDPAHPEASSFLDITPTTLDIEDLRFFITPMDDPYKAYNDPSVQIQPNITIKLIARASPEIAGEFKGKVADIVLESTVSSRTYNEIMTACNLQECIDGDKRDCPKRPCKVDAGGTCVDPSVAQVTCAQGVWPICTDETYTSFVNPSGRPDGLFAPLGDALNTFYEADNEVGSCNSANFPDPNDIIACRQARCEDGFDNDGNGLSDSKDASCLFVLCNNGVKDPLIESCIDVGGSCYFRPQTSAETNCSDGYDNDCNGLADEFDPNCIKSICSDGQTSIGPFPARNSLSLFLRADYPQQNYLLGATAADQDPVLSEKCPDIGGLCSGEKSVVSIPGNPARPNVEVSKALQASETGDFCYDRLDNDCGGKADELDPNCKTAICSNLVLDDKLTPSDYTPADYLAGYSDPLGIYSDNDEECVDRGGVCGAKASSENTFEFCSNGIDDDCNGRIDQEDIGINACCQDADGDTFSPFRQGLGGPMCSPPDGDPLNAPPGFPYGKIDCNDSDTNIRPGAAEVCDDAVYPAGDPLAGQPVDNNCSGANGTTNGSDDNMDPACCVDLDGDGYGTSAAGIYDNTDTGGCRHSANPADPGYKQFDCNDNPATGGAAINPGAPEICGDGIDNNCDGNIDEGCP